MRSQKRIETRGATEKTEATRDAVRPDPVKVLEMGDVSVETKGTVAGLELGPTPRF